MCVCVCVCLFVCVCVCVSMCVCVFCVSVFFGLLFFGLVFFFFFLLLSLLSSVSSYSWLFLTRLLQSDDGGLRERLSVELKKKPPGKKIWPEPPY